MRRRGRCRRRRARYWRGGRCRWRGGRCWRRRGPGCPAHVRRPRGGLHPFRARPGRRGRGHGGGAGRAGRRPAGAHRRARPRAPHQPLFSSLRLADGPLTVYDLERLRHPPEIVILAACDSGRFVVRPGDELLGLSATFLALGTRTIVAPVLSILDVESTTLMIALHKLLAAGHSTAAALAQAQQQVAGEDLAAYAVAAGFVCMGADSTVPG
ncbi:CHAT domain-containing protein [Nonomuraea rubra]|uniref:CHAT domain-containing protein n=1 Tax=Nonomuraea rubra TaxID=46180 RepID=UPI00361AA6C7